MQLEGNDFVGAEHTGHPVNRLEAHAAHSVACAVASTLVGP
jgi:hypothetical protein